MKRLQGIDPGEMFFATIRELAIFFFTETSSCASGKYFFVILKIQCPATINNERKLFSIICLRSVLCLLSSLWGTLHKVFFRSQHPHKYLKLCPPADITRRQTLFSLIFTRRYVQGERHCYWKTKTVHIFLSTSSSVIFDVTGLSWIAISSKASVLWFVILMFGTFATDQNTHTYYFDVINALRTNDRNYHESC